MSLFEQLKLSRPDVDELGYADSVLVEEIGDVRVCFVLLFLERRFLFHFCVFPHNSWPV
jgi:hypothetical protein